MSTILTTIGSSTLVLFVGSTLLAFLAALALTPLVGALARRFGLMDMPGGRRQHPEPIPRIGGLGIALAFGLAVFTFWLVDRLNGHPFLIPEEVRTPRFTLTAIAAVPSASVNQAILSPFFVVRSRRLVTIAATLAGALSG